ncbi:FMN-binding negative transcriptional regulator [Pleomorphomonas oryzae]|uniref:FMN-binding negative transcriptional regulator n=1 Tax=Pleomorphomonas oryzae TaxID=261934 RepID=UPI001FDF18D7|nr:FMN-binding negative transcriptional regulator [Pleomorphomonas oryzae]
MGCAMYLPEHFNEVDPEAVAAVIAAAPLAAVVAQTRDGLIANHIPLIAGKDGALVGHVALANDMHRLIDDGQEILAIFHGADGYITPNSYPSKAEHHRAVPTWNYQVAHVYGAIHFQHDERSKCAALGLLTHEHERRVSGDKAWRMSDGPADYIVDMLSKIVAFRIVVTRTIAKSKLSQNRDRRDFGGAVAALRERGESALADAMEARWPKGE